MSDWIYSDNEEVWYQYDVEEAVSNVLEQMQHKQTPFDITIYKGKPRKHNASEFLPNDIWDQMTDIAYDNVGDHVENWASTCINKKFNEALSEFVDEWFDSNHKVTFFTVDDIEPVRVKITSWQSDDFEYEVLTN